MDEDKVTYSTRYDILALYVKESINQSIKKTYRLIRKANFELENGRYLVRVKTNTLIDNQNYEYHFDVLNLQQLCEIADELNE
jgi:hypothetical protein